jgi:D-beta-D-heptose 7-phosphate kinase/D-beta-D-heptose 1-phosphate adenosyltransferase
MYENQTATKKVVVVSGGFDPLHSGHIAYLNEAKNLGDILVVGINSNEWLIRKKGKFFMDWYERSKIIKAIKSVDYVVNFDDIDDTAINLLHAVKQTWPGYDIVFANGGDRTKDNTPEMSVDNVEFVFGVGGQTKTNSSSNLLDEWKSPKTERPWGFYRVLYETPNTKVKELVVNPNQSLTMQKHEYRNEHWHVVEGEATVIEKRLSSNSKNTYYKHSNVQIPVGVWHQLQNNSNELLKIIEIQYGKVCEEKDIERK